MITRFFGMDIHEKFATITAVDAQQDIVYPAVNVPMAQLSTWAAEQLTGDVVVFVNGLTLAVIELKNPADESATVKRAFNQ